MWKKLLERFKKPNTIIIVATFILSIIFIALSFIFMVLGMSNKTIEYLSYPCYAVAFIGLAYSVYIIVCYGKNAKSKIVELLNKNRLTSRMINDFGFRMVVFTVSSFIFNIAFGAFNIVLSVLEGSVWYLMIAVYYISLSVIRGGVLIYQRKKEAKSEIAQVKTYQRCGGLLILINLVLCVAVVQMVYINRSFKYGSLFIFVVALYAFIKISAAIVNIVKSRKENDYSVKTVTCINLTDATVSILALQTAMLTEFSKESSEINARYFNGATGAIVCIFTLGLGIYMIIKSRKRIKEIKSERDNGEQGV